MSINVVLSGSTVAIDRWTFEALFSNSVISERKAVARAIAGGGIDFEDLRTLARKAEIPWGLFFAPRSLVKAQLDLKRSKLMAGFSKKHFSLHSRGRVTLSDVELIVKDLMRKQMWLRRGEAVDDNSIVGMLRRPGPTVSHDSGRLTSALGFSSADLRAAKSKEQALDLIVGRLEANRILVSISSRNYMPQLIPDHASFSGLTIRDKKFPYIFLSSAGGEGDNFEPVGRRIFTLTLLSVLVARGIFVPVSYDSNAGESASVHEFMITEEILMPEREFRAVRVSSLDDVKDIGDVFKVTPSAVVMRLRRLGLVSYEQKVGYLEELRHEFLNLPKQHMKSPLAVNALRKYNGSECSRRMLDLLDAGVIKPRDFCRVMFSNKLKPTQIDEFRRSVR